jgi:hypothetical protein
MDGKLSGMTSFVLAIERVEGLKFWGYGNPGKWVPDVQNARLYARRQSAANARVLILKSRKDIPADTLRVLEVS